jgi:hypothetical protein
VAPATKVDGVRGYLDIPVQVNPDSWQVEHVTLETPEWICVPEGAGVKKPEAPPHVTAPAVAFGDIRAAGVFAWWQVSQLALLGAGMWELVPEVCA